MSNIYSLTQRWSPFAGNNEKGMPGRPHLQVVMNESTGEKVIANMTDEPVHVMDLAAWVAELLPKERGELWLDKLAWSPVFRLLLPNYLVKFEARPPHLHRFFQEIEEKTREQRTTDDYCLLELFGAELALQFYRNAWDYLGGDSLRSGRLQAIRFQNDQGNAYEVFFDPQGEPGFGLKDLEGNFCLGMSYGTPAFVAAVDLELLEATRIDFFANEYPWILTRQPEGLTAQSLGDLIWLLEHLPRFARKKSAHRSGGRTLRRRPKQAGDPS
ncbi:MAG: hypothetical protein KF760_03010 [Candidatus Eremiobacteraeota bacterium]|nr:hypothetical protein [Candidatus Eremiobacteraeota bacterium]MCW5870223.1 hypothetical protein [Candidatus Eremiobacteraeota bacterium]